MNLDNDARTLDVTGTTGRDAGKNFRIAEVPPLDMASFVLRLLAALRLQSVEDFSDLIISGKDGTVDTAQVMRILAGCDPAAVKALIEDALKHVEIAPDPQYPTAFRRMDVANDLREMATLTQILGGFARVNVSAG